KARGPPRPPSTGSEPTRRSLAQRCNAVENRFRECARSTVDGERYRERLLLTSPNLHVAEDGPAVRGRFLLKMYERLSLSDACLGVAQYGRTCRPSGLCAG